MTDTLITILSILFGYILGRFNRPEEVLKSGFHKIYYQGKEIVEEILPKSDLKPGLYKRPTAHDLYEKSKPKEEKEAEKAMVETLDQIPELKEARDKVKELKERGVI